MRVSLEWLKEILQQPLEIDAIVEKLPLIGLEVDAVLPAENDTIFEIGITPNRADCLSMFGIAREIAALFEYPFTMPKLVSRPQGFQSHLEIINHEPKLCPLYCARVIRGINNHMPLPAKILERIQAAGMRSVNPVVDILNFVMLKTGQPLHAFHADVLGSTIEIRHAHEHEKMVALGGTTLTLNPKMLVIANQTDVQALAGVIGSQKSEVTEECTTIVIEGAHFIPTAVAGVARKLGLQTEAAYRFERFVDSNLVWRAIELASHLILDHLGGEASQIVEDIHEKYLPQPKHINLRREQLQTQLGLTLADETVEAILTRLGFTTMVHHQGFEVQVPSFRADVSLEVDLLEEIARLAGYEHIPATMPALRALPFVANASQEDLWLQTFVHRHYHHAVNFTFISARENALFQSEENAAVLKNPISSDLAVMRASLLPGLLRNVKINLGHQCESIRLVEAGPVFSREGDAVTETLTFAAVIAGNRYSDHFMDKPNRPHDFFDLKGDVESLFHEETLLSFERTKAPQFHPGKTANILYEGKVIGIIGQLDVTFLKALEIDEPVFAVEMNVPLAKSSSRCFKTFSRFPKVKRDLAVLVDENVPVQALMNACQEQLGEHLWSIFVFDVYQGKGVEFGKKSVALGFLLHHPTHTLTEDEIQSLMSALLTRLQSQFSAILREF